MKYIISAIGKTKNQHEDLITDKYLKRIKNIQIKQYEVKFNNEQKKIEEEGLKLINSTPPNGKLVLLDEQGENLTSLELAKIILSWRDNNISYINFAIGGAFGNGEEIKKRATKILAFGKLTWPHQMVKMMIAEQIYRIETIIQGHPYHK
ncbi:23S rRNA (pseudouridine(1915)-N(3))-methyltransferase RlmH [Alphaproteobacteria bacterium]|nr:23S rRNA (pseudouridine(1915)-N(3))-methyltransferase RlmH [Alphaproteobacteria bacterium]